MKVTVLEGAVLAIADINGNQSTAVSVVATSVTVSLTGLVSTSSLSPPFLAPGRMDKVSTVFPQDSFADILYSLAKKTTQYLTQIGISSSDLATTIKSAIMAMTAELSNIGVVSSEISTVAQAITAGAVGVLDDAGISDADMSAVVENVITGVLTGLESAGLSETEIAAADEVATGAIEGIQSVGADNDSDEEALVITVQASVEAALTTQDPLPRLSLILPRSMSLQACRLP